MKHLLFLLLLITHVSQVFADSTKEKLTIIGSYLQDDIDSAYLLSQELLELSENDNDLYGIVKSNFFLGYITARKGDFGKSVIYYLEAIRQAEKATYDGINYDKISLRKNLANIFRRFEANRLATKYNLESIELAILYNQSNELTNLQLNQALVYQNDNQFDKAAQLLQEILDSTKDKVFESEILNQIGLVFLENGNFEKARGYFERLLDYPDEAELYIAKALHNLGEIHYELGETQESISKLKRSIAIMESINGVEEYSLFLSYRNIGRYLFEVDNIEEAEIYLKKAEEIASYAEWDASSFEIYKTLSNLYYLTGAGKLGKKYSELHFLKIQKYLETQEEIQKKDKEYNFDLITKRYFDEVAKQEQIASILFYSKLISGSLLALLLFSVGYNWYQKVRMRRSIVRELVDLKIID